MDTVWNFKTKIQSPATYAAIFHRIQINTGVTYTFIGYFVAMVVYYYMLMNTDVVVIKIVTYR